MRSNESGRMFVGLNIVPKGVLSALFSDPSKANCVPDGKRELLTGWLGQLTVQVVPEQEIDWKLLGPPTVPGGLGVPPHSMLPSSIMSTDIPTPDSAKLRKEY